MMECGYEKMRRGATDGGGGGGGGGGDLAMRSGGGHVAAAAVEAIERLAGGGAVVVFSVSTCCMCHVVKSLLCGMGVNLTVYELDELEATAGMRIEEALRALIGAGSGSGSGSAEPPLPAVFVGGKLLGGLDHVMAAHISGALVPLLKDAGALWL